MSRMEDINCSPVKLSSAKKRRKVLKFDDCIICKHGGNCVLATPQGAQCLLKVAQQFKDEVHDRICLTFGDSPDENIELYYHRICYQKYTSRTNQQHWVQAHDTTADTGSSPWNVSTEQQSNSFSTRSSAPISWNNCLICGFKKHRGNKNLHVIQSFERANDLLQAAEELKDDSVLCRIIGEDLVAKEGLYHETCMKKYLRSARNVASTLEKDTSGKEPTQRTCAFERLVQEIEPLLFDQDKALGLPLLILRYNELALELGEPKWISTQLKNKLCSHYSQRITVQTIAGKGSPNIILNSKIKLSDAILAAQELKEDLTRLQYKSYTDTDLLSSCLTDEKQVQETLRNAAAILSHEMKELKSKEDFPSPSDIQQNSSEQFVPSSLLNFIQLLLDPKAYESTEEYAPSEEMRRKAVTIAECILHSSRNITTPFHLGLAVQLHHNHGSRHLIDTLHSYGLCVSYSELRLFLTSVAEEELKKIEKGTYKPSGIVPVLEGGCLLQEGDDNIDMNIETIDGKNTFHSMARVIFQMNRIGVHNTEHQLIPRGKSRSLQVSENVNDLMNLIHYDKPHKRPEPPRHADALKLVESSMKALSPTKDLTWVLLRMLCRNVLPISKNPIDKQNIPFWTDYNKKLAERQEQYTTVSYAPLIDAKPTDPSTVYTSMVRCMEMSSSLGQVNSIQTMDLQLYAIAQNIKWSQPQRFKNHILRLGGFHEVQCYIAAIGKLWGDAGLLDLLVDSGVYASITAEQMLAGKQYHRAVRGLTLTYEVMMQAYQVEFLKWCELNNHSSNLQKIWLQAEEIVSESMQKEKVAEIEDLVESVMEPLMKLFNECGRERSPTFSFWLNFLQAIQVLLLNIRAECESNWDNHIATQGRMLPYIFAADRTNYARYIPVYILDMLNLPEDIKEAFDEGQHTFREKPGKFNSIWSDMGVEKTVIRDAKSDGGVIGFTRKQGALLRWTVTRHLIGVYSATMQDRSGVKKSEDPEKEQCSQTSLSRDEKHVEAMYNHLTTGMSNPFDLQHPDVLFNISTGALASPEVQRSLLNAVTKGKKKMEAFISDTLSEGGEKPFYQPISRSGVLTFTDKKKKTKLFSPGGVRLVHISSEMVFRRALCLVDCRNDISLKTVLSHPIGAVPTSLFSEDGTMRKTVKSDLLKKLEATSKTVINDADLPSPKNCTVYIRDAMALIRSMKFPNHFTFDNLGDMYINNLTKGLLHANTVVDVFDQYDHPESVKAVERSRRGDASGVIREYHITPGRQVPHWNKFLLCSANKKELNRFLCQKIEQILPGKLSQGQEVFVAGGFATGSETKCITLEGSTLVEDLSCTQEEADTRMILHAMNSDRSFEKAGIKGHVIIRSPDTDVLVLSVHYFSCMKNVEQLWFETGVSSSRRYIPVHEICASLSPSMCSALPAIHALTGCDSTSAFFGIGKKTVFKVLERNENLLTDSAALAGDNVDDATKVARGIVCALYDVGRKHLSSHASLNDMRLSMCKMKDIDLAKLPPCEDTFAQHVKRVMWQTRIWTNAHIPKPEIGNPESYGWTKNSDVLVPVHFEGKSASEILDCLVCACRHSCSKAQCSCKQHGLNCIELCMCRNDCVNTIRPEIANNDEE